MQPAAQLPDDIGQQVCRARADQRAAEMPVRLKRPEAVAAICLCNGEGGLAVICLPLSAVKASGDGSGRIDVV